MIKKRIILFLSAIWLVTGCAAGAQEENPAAGQMAGAQEENPAAGQIAGAQEESPAAEQTPGAQEESSAAGQMTGTYQTSVGTVTQGDYISIQYPVLTGIDGYDPEIVDEINQIFYDEAVQAAKEQSEDMEWTAENYAATNPDILSSLAYEGTCESMFVDGNTYSVSILYYSYMGGPHPNSFVTGRSFDLSTGKEMTMEELLGCDETAAQDAVVEAYRKDVIGQLIGYDGEAVTESTIRDSFDMMEYWMEEDGMHVVIGAYGIAPYVAGPQSALVTPEILAAVSEGARSGAADTGSDSVLGADTVSPDGDNETIPIINGILADASDFIFPYSSTQMLTDADLTKLEGASVEEEHYNSQLAINEILVRYGYAFDPEQGGSAKEAYDRFEGLAWYEAAKPYCPSASASEMLYTYINSTELANIDIICEWQKAHDCYY